MAENEQQWTSLGIAICLSGGGYRAAGFHLGTLAYLERVGMLPNLAALSTVSGGTFTGAAYILSLLEDLPFNEFYSRFHDFLRDTHLVARGLSLLGDPAPNPSGRRDVIVSMAQVYAETFFRRDSGEPYLLGDILEAGEKLPDVSFNSTEFRTGVAFRFQSRQGAIIGNGNVRVPAVPARSIRLADVVAASSCFPGGFEPLDFPDDFVWPGGTVPPEIRESLTKGGMSDRVALMDGGVYDNQGATTLDLAVEGRADDLSMFMISDVDQESDELYKYPDSEPVRFMGRRTLGQIRILLGIILSLCALSTVTVALHLFREVSAGTVSIWDVFLYVVPLVLAAITSLSLWHLRSFVVDEVLAHVPQVGVATVWDDLKRIKLTQLSEMLRLRLTSLFALTSSVFMKRIRELVFKSIYRSERYQHKRVANLIYDLEHAGAPGEGLPEPAPSLRDLSGRAAGMDTTLWFDDVKQLHDLVTCGQATTCFNLIRLIQDAHGKDPSAYPSDVASLWEKATDDWRTLQSDTNALLPK